MPDGPVGLADQIAEIEREIALRERVYPQWVSAEKLRPTTAARQMTRLRAVLATLQDLARERAP